MTLHLLKPAVDQKADKVLKDLTGINKCRHHRDKSLSHLNPEIEQHI